MPLLPENLRKPNKDVALPRISVFLRGYERLGGRAGLALAIGMAGMLAHGASPPSIEDFASRARIEDASISPDGRYLAVIQTLDGRGRVIVDDRQGGKGEDHLHSF